MAEYIVLRLPGALFTRLEAHSCDGIFVVRLEATHI